MFRINTFEIGVPPLRERPEDIMPLAKHLLRRHRSDGGDRQLFTDEAIAGTDSPTSGRAMFVNWPT